MKKNYQNRSDGALVEPEQQLVRQSPTLRMTAHGSLLDIEFSSTLVAADIGYRM